MLNNIFLLFLWFSPEAQPRTLELNIERSEISFEVTHMGFLTVEGTFSMAEASIEMENKEPVRISGTIQVQSIDTDEPSRDETLLSEGYLDAIKFPTIRFKSDQIRKNGTTYIVLGKLEIKEVEKAITFPCEINVKTDRTLTLEAEIPIKRSDFLLDFGAMNALIGDEITVAVELQFEEQ